MADVQSEARDTTPVRAAHAFDADRLAAYLAAHVAGFAAPLRVRQFKNGQSNPTFLLTDANGKQYVMRKQPPGKLLSTAHAVDREYHVCRALHSVGYPVAKMLCLCEDTGVIGTKFYVMEFLNGRIFRDSRMPELAPKQRAEIIDAMNAAMARLHSLDPAAIGLADFGRAGNYYERQISRWAAQYRATETGKIEAMDWLIEWLPANIPSEGRDQTTLVHGDFRLDNMIFHPTEPRVIGVLDWELSTLGHPLSDVAYNCLMYQFPPTSLGYSGVAGLNLEEHGIPALETYLEAYCRRTKRAGIDNFPFYLAFSLFRATAILQGVYKRSLMGNASSENARMVGAMAKMLAQRGRELVDGKTAGAQAAYKPKWELPFVPLQMSDRARELFARVERFMHEHVLPGERVYEEQLNKLGGWKQPPVMEELKARAKREGLWNFFLKGEHGAGITVLEYSFLAELMGRSGIAPEVFNCGAPDTGNMEVLEMFGTPAQKEQWLTPLLDGAIRSCFAMTEPAVASSDATNIDCAIRRDGGDYVINGTKWWISGAAHPNCKICLVLGRQVDLPSDTPMHRRHSLVLVPMNTPGLHVGEALDVLGVDDRPFGHCIVQFKDVRVPLANIVLGEGRGFEIAQARLGPGRIHHCMRLIGMAETALELMKQRAVQRKAFGKPLALHQVTAQQVAQLRIRIEQARLLCTKAAAMIDLVGARGAMKEIAMIKVVAPNVACDVVDAAMQTHGAAGLSSTASPLSRMYSAARALRVADGPDIVHEMTIAKLEMRPRM